MMDKLCKLLQVEKDWFPPMDSYTAAPDFLYQIAEVVLKGDKSIVECGSGVSTLVLARCIQLKGGNLISLEHDELYAAMTENWLRDRGLRELVKLYQAPLTGNPPNYDLSGVFIDNVDLLVIDGPPASVHPMVRHGARQLFPMLSKGALVLMDDLHRDGERAVFKKWMQEFPQMTFTTIDTERGCGKIVNSDKKRICIAVPNEGWIHKHVAFSLMRIQLDTRYKVRIMLPTHSPSDNNRHHIFNDFLQGGEDYLLCIDSDNPPMNNPLDLVELDKDFIACPTPVYYNNIKKRGDRPYYWNVYKYNEAEDGYNEWPVQEKLQKVDAVGSGCILYSRRVLEHPEMRKGANQRSLNEDGTVHKGGDIMFCERARANGFEVWAHYSYPCRHFNEVELIEMIEAFQEIR